MNKNKIIKGVNQENIIKCSNLISPYIKLTPIVSNNELNRLLGAKCYFKCENFQITNSFKIRGAYSSVIKTLQNSENVNLNIATHSSGNHGIALNYVGQTFNLNTHVVVPNNAPLSKLDAMKKFNQPIYLCTPSIADRQYCLEQVMLQHNAIYIPSANDDNIILGQASCAYEIFQIQNLDANYIIAPIGGGGLLSGTCLSTKLFNPKCKIIGAEPELANDCKVSFNDKQKIDLPYSTTIADGLRVPLAKRPWEIIKECTDDVLTCSEAQIVEAMQLINKYFEFNVEPSAATPLAVILSNLAKFANKNVIVLLTGGNISQTEVNQICRNFI